MKTVKTYGYIRVSSKDQNEERQLISMARLGIERKHIYIDKQSGKDFKRLNYKKLIRKIHRGDIVVIDSIDRLGRNYEDILEQWHIITKQKKVHIKVLDMPLLDTTNNKLDLTGTFIADLVLQILSYVAEKERHSIKRRQREGIDAAQARGVIFGRPTLNRPEVYTDIKGKWECREINSREAAKILEVSQGTFLNWIRLDKNSTRTQS